MDYFYLKSRKKVSQGFTLVESLVAITVLLIGVLGPLVLATSSITDGISNKNKISAIYLAQEGIDLIIAMRDANTNPLIGDWDRGLVGTIDCNKITNSSGCSVKDDIAGNTITVAPCNLSDCTVQLTGGPIFTRRIFVNEVIPDQQLKIESQVEWFEKGNLKGPYSLTTFIYFKR